MSTISLVGIFFVLAGFLGFAFGGVEAFYDAQIGQAVVGMNERVRISEWLSAGAVAGGLLMLMFERRIA